MSKFDAVIFDYGNVLSLEQAPDLIEKMAAMLNIGVAEFEHQYWHFRAEYDRGIFDGAQYWQHISEAVKVELSSDEVVRLIETDNRSWSRPNELIVRWAHSLRYHNIKIAILSNMPIDFRLALHVNCAWLPEFDQRTYSCELKVCKPDAEIYEYCLRGLQVRPERCLFIDDRLPNVEAARRLGIESLHFLRTEDVCAELHAAFGWDLASAR
jgi:putative hydrolase of the HAD superfamily